MTYFAVIPKEEILEIMMERLERYLVKGERTVDLVADPSQIDFWVHPSWIAPMFQRNEMHENEFAVFGHFKNPSDLVLDCGAMIGNSVVSLRAAGCSTSVLSFEPQMVVEPCLAEVSRIDQKHDYRITGLGAEESSLTFVTPVLNGKAVTGLTSLDLNIPFTADNLYTTLKKYMDGAHYQSLTFHSFTALVKPLDAVLQNSGPFKVPTDNIVAAKIDTDYSEAQVLIGAVETLKTHRPLLMIEGGNHVPSVCKILFDLDYVCAAQDGNKLRLSDDPTQGYNGFFIHHDRIPQYRAEGLLE